MNDRNHSYKLGAIRAMTVQGTGDISCTFQPVLNFAHLRNQAVTPFPLTGTLELETTDLRFTASFVRNTTISHGKLQISTSRAEKHDLRLRTRRQPRYLR